MRKLGTLVIVQMNIFQKEATCMNTNLKNFSSGVEESSISIRLDSSENIVTCIIAPLAFDSNGEAINKAVVQICSDVFDASVFISVE